MIGLNYSQIIKILLVHDKKTFPPKTPIFVVTTHQIYYGKEGEKVGQI